MLDVVQTELLHPFPELLNLRLQASVLLPQLLAIARLDLQVAGCFLKLSLELLLFGEHTAVLRLEIVLLLLQLADLVQKLRVLVLLLFHLLRQGLVRSLELLIFQLVVARVDVFLVIFVLKFILFLCQGLDLALLLIELVEKVIVALLKVRLLLRDLLEVQRDLL